MIFRREWAMPCADTFDCPPIEGMVKKYLMGSKISIDPFARNKRWATHTNDLNPNTAAEKHMDAEVFLASFPTDYADLFIFDPPYSNEQMSRSYKDAGFTPTTETTQNGGMYSRVRDEIALRASSNAIVLSFGWNSCGMGKGRGYEIIEIMLVCHGGAHNDTICIAEQRMQTNQEVLAL